MRFEDVTLAGPADLARFYGDVLGLPLDGDAILIGETTLHFEVQGGGAFYHFALLVPGDRFEAALAWARQRVELLGGVFDSENWDSRAVYFHDPAGNILELIAHDGLEDDHRSGGFAAEELVGFSELGIVGDRHALVQELEAAGLELWDGELDEPDRLAFVGEKARTIILAPPGRGWLPTGRPAEPHPSELKLELAGARIPLRF
jgi:catechol 2,3-dioxygenase-like lactoylglutathione lyase family enzyme